MEILLASIIDRVGKITKNTSSPNSNNTVNKIY